MHADESVSRRARSFTLCVMVMKRYPAFSASIGR
jgi:hypothetical protein